MAFIKIGNTVINTDYVVAVDLNRISRNGKGSVVIQMAAARGLFNSKLKELRFSGEFAKKLLAYFSNPNNAVDLSEPQPFYDREPPTYSLGLDTVRDQLEDAWEEPETWDNTGSEDPPCEPPLPHPLALDDSELFYGSLDLEKDAWADDIDLPDEPPPPPTVRRRPWGPQSPSPFSATTFPDPVDPTIP